MPISVLRSLGGAQADQNPAAAGHTPPSAAPIMIRTIIKAR